MLAWVANNTASSATGTDKRIKRIGFAMGSSAAVSRIMTTACGGVITYATFGDVVAPGQIDIDELIANYRVGELNSESRVVAVCHRGSGDHSTDHAMDQVAIQKINNKVRELNSQSSLAGANRVAIGFHGETVTTLKPYGEPIRITEFEEI